MVDPILRLPALLAWVEQEVRAVTKRDVRKKAIHLARLLNKAYFRLSPHRDPFAFEPPQGYSFFDAAAWGSTFTAREFKAGLGGTTGDYQRYAERFWAFERGNRAYSRKRQLTKLYLLTPATVSKMTAFWRDLGETEVVDRSTGRELTKADFPTNGVLRSSFSSAQVPGVVEFDLARLDDTIAREEGQGSALASGLGFRHALTLRHLYRIRRWVRVLGGVPNLYEDYTDLPSEGSGRLWGIGEVHLQRLPRTPRTLLYEGTGWWDYDFSTCHPRIFLALAEAEGFECPFLRDYIDFRETVTTELGTEWDIPDAKVKQLVNSMLFGQQRSQSRRASMRQLLHSADTVEKVRNDLYYTSLWTEIHEAREAAIERHRTVNGLINAVGKVMPTSVLEQASSWQQLSFVLTGYEAWALNLVCDGLPGLLVLIHDGFVLDHELDTATVENTLAVRSKQEFNLDFDWKLKARQF